MMSLLSKGGPGVLQLVCRFVRCGTTRSWGSTSALRKRRAAPPMLSNPAAARKIKYERTLLDPHPRRPVKVRRKESNGECPVRAFTSRGKPVKPPPFAREIKLGLGD